MLKKKGQWNQSWCPSCCHHLQSRGPLWGPKQLPPLSLSTIIKLIKALQSRRCPSLPWTAAARRWAGGVTNVGGMTVIVSVTRRRLCFFCLTLFCFALLLRNAAKLQADGACWRGARSPCAHMAAPSRPSSKRPQVGCLGHASLTRRSSRGADLPHTQMDRSPAMHWYHQFGVRGDFSGPNSFLWCLWGNGELSPQSGIQFINPKEKVVGIVVGQLAFGTSRPVYTCDK